MVDSEYNQRRAECEKAVRYFAGKLDHRILALRDVTIEELEKEAAGLGSLLSVGPAMLLQKTTGY